MLEKLPNWSMSCQNGRPFVFVQLINLLDVAVDPDRSSKKHNRHGQRVTCNWLKHDLS